MPVPLPSAGTGNPGRKRRVRQARSASTTMTPKEATFTDLVSSGLRRAYRAAELVERQRKIPVAVELVYNRCPYGGVDQIGRSSLEDLPQVRFACAGRIELVSVGASFGQMLRAIKGVNPKHW